MFSPYPYLLYHYIRMFQIVLCQYNELQILLVLHNLNREFQFWLFCTCLKIIFFTPDALSSNLRNHVSTAHYGKHLTKCTHQMQLLWLDGSLIEPAKFSAVVSCQVPMKCVDVRTSVPFLADQLSPRHRQLKQSQRWVWLEFCLLFTQHIQGCQVFPGLTLCSSAGCEPGQYSSQHTQLGGLDYPWVLELDNIF